MDTQRHVRHNTREKTRGCCLCLIFLEEEIEESEGSYSREGLVLTKYVYVRIEYRG